MFRKTNDLSSQLEKNYKYAAFGMQYINTNFPLGGINRKDVAESLDAKTLIDQLVLMQELRDSYEGQPNHELITRVLSQLKGAFCGELCALAMREITANFPKSRVEIINVAKHQLLVIGRQLESDDNNIMTWGASAVCLDTWSKQIYKALDFYQVRDESKNIPFLKFKGDTHAGIKKTEIKGHYLAGNPHVLDSVNNSSQAEKSKNIPEEQRLYELGVKLFKQKKYNEAIESISQALEAFKKSNNLPEQASCHSALSSCYREQTDITQAIEHAHEALKIRKQCFGSNHQLTQAVIKKLQELERLPLNRTRRY